MHKFSILLFAAIVLPVAAIAQAPPYYTHAVPAKYAFRFAWTKRTWQGNDTPYRAARRAIMQQLEAGTPPDTLIAKYKAAHLQDPENHLKLFQWACSLVLPNNDRTQMTNMEGLPETFEEAKPPYTHEFIRMHYLAAEQRLQNDYVTALGERLAAYDKEDFDVIRHLAEDIGTETSGAKEKALAYAHRLIELRPDTGTGYGVTADIYEKYYVRSILPDNGNIPRRVADAKAAIHWNELYIQKETRDGPRFDRARDGARASIKQIEKWLVEYK